MALELRNPHSILAALDRRPSQVLEVRISSSRPADAWIAVVDRARAAGIPVRTGAAIDPGRQRHKHGPTERTGGGLAKVKPPVNTDVGELWAPAHESASGVWLALDCIQDPQNVGSVFRSAAFFGIRGIIISKDRSAPVNATVCDVAAGGVETVPFAVVTNLRRALQEAKDNGLWVVGASEHAGQDVFDLDRDRCWLLVLGNEQHGMRRLTGETCDEICRLAPRGDVGSLNVSVAAGALMAVLTQTR